MFKNIVFDFDSTLTSLEGLDEIAKEKGVVDEISKITAQGMNGELSFDQSLDSRLIILNPNKSDFSWLARKYANNLVAGAKDLINELKDAHVDIFLVTGGPRPAVEPAADLLGIDSKNIWAVCFDFDKNGQAKIDNDCIMTTANGKADVVKKIAKNGNTIVVGDGMTDFNAGIHADMFIGFGGVVKRESVKRKSKIYIEENNILQVLNYVI